jgi:hypothetical protein
MVQQICKERGWQIDAEGIYVIPKRNGMKLFFFLYMNYLFLF